MLLPGGIVHCSNLNGTGQPSCLKVHASVKGGALRKIMLYFCRNQLEPPKEAGLEAQYRQRTPPFLYVDTDMATLHTKPLICTWGGATQLTTTTIRRNLSKSLQALHFNHQSQTLFTLMVFMG